MTVQEANDFNGYHTFCFFERILHFNIDESLVNVLLDYTYRNLESKIGEERSLANGTQLRDLHKDKEFMEIFKPVTQIMYEAGAIWLKGHHISGNKQKSKKRVRFILGDVWINQSPPGAYNTMHTHTFSNISVVIYLKAPPKCGQILFPDPFPYYSAAESPYAVTPQKGLGLMFNSRLPHMVDINRSEEDRVSIALNMRFTDLPLIRLG